MKVLILAYDFPPNGSIGGQRPFSWFKYFKAFGIHPVVVTRHWKPVTTAEDCFLPIGEKVVLEESESGTVIRVPFKPNLRDRILLKHGGRYSFLRKALSLWFSIAQYFLAKADNRRPILHEARAFLKYNPCSIILATGEPFILFHYASILSKEFDLPWVADYRDGWSTNNDVRFSKSILQKILNAIVTRIERDCVQTSSLITVASPTLINELSGILPGKNMEVIYNGYFPELFESIEFAAITESKKFMVVYSGTLYPNQRLELFLDGFHLFIQELRLLPENVELKFIGLKYQPDQMIRCLNYKDSLKGYIYATQRMTHEETVEELRKASVLLLLANASYGQIYAKIFDYIALNKPILMCENDRGPLETILNDVGNGLMANSSTEVCEILKELYQRPQTAKSPLRSIDHFSRKTQAQRLASHLKSLAGQ